MPGAAASLQARAAALADAAAEDGSSSDEGGAALAGDLKVDDLEGSTRG